MYIHDHVWHWPWVDLERSHEPPHLPPKNPSIGKLPEKKPPIDCPPPPGKICGALRVLA